MKPIQSIRYFLSSYTTRPDRLCLILLTFGMIGGIGLILLNKMDFHFTTVMLFESHISTLSWFKAALALVLCTLFLFYGMFIQRESPRSSTFLWAIGLYCWTVLVNTVIANGLEATPFPPIDHALARMDLWMGINTPALMAWAHNHPHFHTLFNYAYDGLVIELVLIPLVLALTNARRALTVFFIAQLISFFVGCAIYYFFPTMAPSGIFHSPYFTASQHDTSLRFFEVHHYLKVTTADGGLIAFPSFHVIWGLLLLNACRGNKWVFYPLAAFTVILFSATVFLGWHYFVDVIGGLVLGIAAIVWAEWYCY